MIDCVNLESVDVTPWHGDVFDHPVYRDRCKLTGKDVHKFYTCSVCPNYEPDYEGMNDWDLRYELRAILNKLNTDDRMQPMSWAFVSKLVERRDKIIEEMKRRGISYQIMGV